MKRTRSPLLIPPDRGVRFRIIVGALFLALSLWAFVGTIEGIQSGVLMWPSRHQPSRYVNRVLHPRAFWTVASIWLGLSTWMFYASTGEIIYAIRLREQQRVDQSLGCLHREHPLYGYMDIVRPGWRERAAHRKTPWKFVSAFLAFAIGALVWYFSFQMMWQVHVRLYPSHAGHLSEFWPDGLRFRLFVSSFLLAMPLGVSSIVLGAIFGNLVIWGIPTARRAFARDAVDCPEIGFRPVMLSLLRWCWIPIVLSFGLSFIGAYTLSSLR
jgi:hypothetical protein